MAANGHRRKHLIGDRDGIEISPGVYRWQCAYCEIELFCPTCVHISQAGQAVPATRDHVIPRSQGGSNELSNQVLCCELCNITKASEYYIEEARMRRIKSKWKGKRYASAPAEFVPDSAARMARHNEAKDCRKARRKSWDSEQEAHRVAKRVLDEVGVHLVTFECERCGKWHVDRDWNRDNSNIEAA